MGDKLTLKKDVGAYFITTTVVDWINIFTEEKYFNIIIENLKFYTSKRGLEIYAFVIMPNHMHMIISNEVGTRISDIIRDFKRMTSRMIIEELKQDGKTKILSHLSFRARIHYKHHKFKVWQDGNHAIELYTPKFTWVRVRYIHNNPVTAGLVDCTTDWKWSSARNYSDMEAVFDDVYCLSAPVNFEN